MKDRKFKVMIARFPGNYAEHPASAQWAMGAALEVAKDPRLEGPILWWKSDTPITMVRNACIQDAITAEVDFVLMIDSDMGPDMDMQGVPSAGRFFKSSVDFAIANYDAGPCLIAAPYCGPPPKEACYVFRWRGKESQSADAPIPYSLEMYTREEAAAMGGIKEAAALPTGLMLIDMRVVTGFKNPHTGTQSKLEPPYFYYEWTDATESAKASTEDVTFSRDASLLGCKNYANWDAWALHYKLKAVGRPTVLNPTDITQSFLKSVGLGERYEANRKRESRVHDPGATVQDFAGRVRGLRLDDGVGSHDAPEAGGASFDAASLAEHRRLRAEHPAAGLAGIVGENLSATDGGFRIAAGGSGIPGDADA